MSKDVGVFDSEQLSAIQSLFDQAWVQAVSSANAKSITDWAALRDLLAQKVLEYAHSSLTDDQVIQAVLSSLGLT